MGALVSDRTTVACWIDASGATIARRHAGAEELERIEAEIPVHHASTGHVRHDPRTRHGGGGAAQDRIAREREERIRTFVRSVAAAIGDEADVTVLGPSGIRDELARALEERTADGHRWVANEPSAPLTDRQLVALLRTRVGDLPRRGMRSVG